MTNAEILVEYWQAAGLTREHVTEMLNKLTNGQSVLLDGTICNVDTRTL